MNDVRPELLSSIIYAWVELKEWFDKVNVSRISYFHKEIGTLTQGIMTVSNYFHSQS